MYDDPANLPEYPCVTPSYGPFALLQLDGGTGILDSGAPVHGRLPPEAIRRLLDSGAPVNGRLPPEVIQHLVRSNFGAFRACYENGMRAVPNLQGRVAVQFVIDRAGAVNEAHAVCTSLPDPKVVRCIVNAFGTLSFPAPEGGLVTVVYPIQFSPGD
jgi:hypothetical protein